MTNSEANEPPAPPVLVGFTPTPRGLRALDAGVAEARLRGVPLHVVSVVSHDPGDSPTRARADMEVSGETEQMLERVRDDLTAEGMQVTTNLLHTQSGGTSRLLLEEADRVDAELIVIGTRRRSPVGKLVMGSIAQDILLGASCPVLTVKVDEREG